MNNGAPTHPNPTIDTAIDLSLCSPPISENFEWNTLPSVLDSDHFPIIISTPIDTAVPPSIRKLRKADWNLYVSSSVWDTIPQDLKSNEVNLADIQERINRACDEAIPSIIPSKFIPKPFWTEDLNRSRAVRETLYQRYRRSHTLEDKLRWKCARAIHKNNVLKHKERSWAEFTSSLNDDMPISEICKKVRKLKGMPPKSIQILTHPEYPTITFSTPKEISEILAKTFATTSADSNHCNEFLQHKAFSEQSFSEK